MEIQVTQEEWDNRNDGMSTIKSDAFALTGLDWEGVHYPEIDDDLMYVFFIKNELVGDRWEKDESMVVGVKVSLV